MIEQVLPSSSGQCPAYVLSVIIGTAETAQLVQSRLQEAGRPEGDQACAAALETLLGELTRAAGTRLRDRGLIALVDLPNALRRGAG